MLTHLHLAVRSLQRSPRYCLAVIATLALAIGGVTAVYAMIHGILLRPLPYRQPDRLVLLFEFVPQLAGAVGSPFLPVNAVHFVEWRERASSFSDMTLYWSAEQTLSDAGASRPARVGVAQVWPSFLSTLGVAPQLGRDFLDHEGEPGKGHSVLISSGFWRDRFGSAPDVLERKVVLDDHAYNVVGVLPDGFRFPDTSAALPALGLSMNIEILRPFELRNRNDEGNFNYWAIGRLRSGVEASRAKAELDTVCSGIAAAWDEPFDLYSIVRPLHSAMVGRSRLPLLLSFAAVGLVLLIGCLNLANLASDRVRSRTGDIALRAAVGAAPGVLVAQFLLEGLVLCIKGGGAGLALAACLTVALQNWRATDLPLLHSVSLDPAVVLFAAAASILSLCLFSGIPALYVARLSPHRALSSSERGGTPPRAARRAAKAFMAGQVALSVILVVVSGLLVQSLRNVLDQDPGLKVEGAAITEVSVSGQKYGGARGRANAFNEMLRGIEALPGVLSAGVVSNPPLGGFRNVSDISAVGEAERPGAGRPFANFRWASPNYFAALGIPILNGRVFRDSDPSPTPVIVSESVAHALWPGRDPLGRQLTGRQGEPLTVVGVSGDIPVESLEAGGSLVVYQPHWYDSAPDSMWLALRSAHDPAGLADSVRETVWNVDPEVPVAAFEPARNLIDRSVASRLFISTLLGLFSLVAFALASLGVYSVAAESASRRTREVGIRCVLGASVERVRRGLVFEGMYPVAFGLAVGIACAYVLARLLQGMLFGVGVADPVTYLVAAGSMTLVALCACYVPVLRASRVAPTAALREA